MQNTGTTENGEVTPQHCSARVTPDGVDDRC